MMEIGRLCMKIAGRDANKVCVIIDTYEDNYVLIDGETRRKKCNMKHLEPLDKIVKIKKNAPREDVKKVFSDLKLGFFEPKSKKPTPRVKKVRVKKEIVEEKPKEKETKKKAEKTEEKETVKKEDIKAQDTFKKEENSKK